MANKNRQQQLAKQRAAARRRQRQLYIGAGAAAVVLVAAALIYLLWPRDTVAATVAAPSGPATCGPVQTPADEGRAHLSGNETPVYQSNPPSSGTHNPIPLPAGTYDTPQDVTMEVHSLEHGYIVINYKNLASSEVNQLQQIVSRDPRKLILAPYPNMDSRVVLTAWDHSQTCTGVNEQAILAFVGDYRDKGPEDVP